VQETQGEMGPSAGDIGVRVESFRLLNSSAAQDPPYTFNKEIIGC